MSLPAELSKLENLRRSGVLSEEEFTAAKGKLLSTPALEASNAHTETGRSMGGLLFLAAVCVVVLLWLIGTAPEQATVTHTVSEYDSQGLASAAGRINIGTRLYLNGKPVGTVLAVSKTDPFSGVSRDMVLIQFDSSSEPEWKTRDVVKSSFRVR